MHTTIHIELWWYMHVTATHLGGRESVDFLAPLEGVVHHVSLHQRVVSRQIRATDGAIHFV